MFILSLAVYGEKDIVFTQQAVERVTSQYPDSRITTVVGKGIFTRARAFERGMTALDNNDLAFLCDVRGSECGTCFPAALSQECHTGQDGVFP